jgi:hypothetical protein
MGRNGSTKYWDLQKSYNQVIRQDLPYDLAVRAWAESLTERDLGAMCADYDRGSRDPSDIDAKLEWRRRHPGRGNGGRGNKTPLGRCTVHKSGRRPAWCEDCKSAEVRRLQKDPAAAPADQPHDEAIAASPAIMDAPDDHPAYPYTSSIAALSLN